MDNLEIAKIFSRIADILEIKNETSFKIRAYRKVAQVLENLPHDIKQLYEENKLYSIPGVGKGIEEKIKELVKTGKLKYYEQLKKETPEELLEIMSISDVGPKTVRLLYEKLQVDSMEKLQKAALENKIRELPGMGQKTQDNILKGIELAKKRKERMPLKEALVLSEKITEPLSKLKEVEEINIAGSLRRMRETIGDIDILLVSDNPKKVMDKFTSLEIVKEVLSRGDTKSSVLTFEDRQVDLRVVPAESFGAALHYFTGSKSHNIRIRELGIKKGLKINEYGIFIRNKKQEKRIGGGQEKDVFDLLGLPFIPVEMREDNGEIEAALENRLPNLITEKDIRGDLHVHSKWSDGGNTVEEMAQEAKKRGYEYVCI
jgi:DNA polymerase (family 10)